MRSLKTYRTYLLLFLWVICSVAAIGQSDSTILSHKQYLRNIILFHPLAKKANLQTKIGQAQWLAAKGYLDPSLSSSWNEKNFDEKLYYRYYGGELRVPTALGLDIVGGYENTEGEFLNDESRTDRFGLWHLGIELNLLQGLYINERRTALKQAEVFQSLSENQRQLLLNDLLYDASTAYLTWQMYFYFDSVLKENIVIAAAYLENTVTAFELGDKTGMDTLEASIMRRDAVNLLRKNEVDYIKAKQNAENFMWLDDVPVNLFDTTKPEAYDNDLFQIRIAADQNTLIDNHPLILSYKNKQANLAIAQQLKREKLKPKLKAKYNPLLSTPNGDLTPYYTANNYKLGLEFSMPILFRQERAEIQRGKIKLKEVGYVIQHKRNELNNKLEGSVLTQVVINEQIVLSEQNVDGYLRLMEGESEKFNFGESSVFLLNKRQDKYISGRLKLIELHIKLQIEQLNYAYLSNDLNE
jgi:outer membrane protein TolC